MLAALELFRRTLPWLGLAALPLAVLLGLKTVDANHWHHQADHFEAQWKAEEAAHWQTVVNYQAAASKAREADAANKARVEAEQKKINEERQRDYEARIARARADAERLRQQLREAGAHPRGPGAAPVSDNGDPAGRPDGAPGDPGLSVHERLVATEQAIRLDELQHWVAEQLGIDMQGK